VLDPEQNHSFSDHYIEVPFDLSQVMFIATANTLATVPAALLDRMEVIELPGYTERTQAPDRRGAPAAAPARGQPRRATTSGERRRLERCATTPAGRRTEPGFIATLPPAASLGARAGSRGAADVTRASLRGAAARRGRSSAAADPRPRAHDPAGCHRRLAHTNHGGDIHVRRATVLPGGEGVRLRITGQLGEVMRESAEAALSWVRANQAQLGLDPKLLTGCEIHLHVPAGAVPKDGPSAGVTMAAALVSALSRRRAHGEVAMTGEISLRGRVLPVGGIKDKVLAASRAGIRTVLLPKRNEKDLVDVPEDVRQGRDPFVDTTRDARRRARATRRLAAHRCASNAQPRRCAPVARVRV
jgi:ATP-dependent Lon protease